MWCCISLILLLFLCWTSLSYPEDFIYGGYLGGSGNDYGNAVAVDGERNVYVTGQSTIGGNTDVFVTKTSADGLHILYALRFGGGNFDYGRGIAVDVQRNAYVVGATSSPSFPVTEGTYNGGTSDAFIAKISPDGELLSARFFGGVGDDYGRGIAVDVNGDIYISGETNSKESMFPVAVGPDLTYNGGYRDAFVAKLSPSGEIIYSGYIGGASTDSGRGLAIDILGNLYVVGSTASGALTFPKAVGPDVTYNGGGDAFIAKVKPDGSGLVYAGYIGGNGADNAYGIAVDGVLGAAYVVGETTSSFGFPVKIGPDLTWNGQSDAFVVKVNALGTKLDYAGFIGGNNVDVGSGIAIDSLGFAYVTGSTASFPSTFPVKNGPDFSYAGYTDAFIAKVSPTGKELVYASYIGGSASDNGYGIAVDDTGAAYVIGQTASPSSSFPALSSWDVTPNGSRDAFLVKVQ